MKGEVSLLENDRGVLTDAQLIGQGFLGEYSSGPGVDDRNSSRLPHATAEAAPSTASTISATGLVPSIGTMPGIRRIHFR